MATPFICASRVESGGSVYANERGGDVVWRSGQREQQEEYGSYDE
jgi:hypothetical protein